eukprot:GEMP01067688.1.p1 GENE.GEMP01067688.1~~GEMP01067688.1.p1  ORF type:complete len:140 (+),score=18.90 GEMP01067688.1:56-475(+)
MSTYLNSDPPVRDKSLLQTSLVCPKGHALESIPASSLMNVPLFYTLHGFVCSRCEISSDNLVDQTANLCYDCGPNNACYCTMCASNFLEKVTQQKLDSMQSVERLAKKPSSHGESRIRGRLPVLEPSCTEQGPLDHWEE